MLHMLLLTGGRTTIAISLRLPAGQQGAVDAAARLTTAVTFAGMLTQQLGSSSGGSGVDALVFQPGVAPSVCHAMSMRLTAACTFVRYFTDWIGSGTLVWCAGTVACALVTHGTWLVRGLLGGALRELQRSWAEPRHDIPFHPIYLLSQYTHWPAYTPLRASASTDLPTHPVPTVRTHHALSTPVIHEHHATITSRTHPVAIARLHTSPCSPCSRLLLLGVEGRVDQAQLSARPWALLLPWPLQWVSSSGVAGLCVSPPALVRNVIDKPPTPASATPGFTSVMTLHTMTPTQGSRCLLSGASSSKRGRQGREGEDRDGWGLRA
jgi:hypothetical protein